MRVRALLDLSWPRPAGPVRDELILHEFLLNTAECQSWPLDLRCCYDIGTVGVEVAAVLDEVHERPATRAEAQDAFEAELGPPPPSAVRFPADITTLAALREFVHRHATAAGVAPDRIDDLAYAVNEVVTNSICHGAGHADLSAWNEPTFFCCDVRDRGRITDSLVGRVKPDSGANSGRGLWLVHHLCDLVQVRSSAAGTTVRMRIDRSPAR
jgi:anti-sigma regulatory factor (Ser/Thr protein kinase)